MLDEQPGRGPIAADPGSDASGGLSQAEAARRLAAQGRNELTARSERRLVATIWEQLSDTVIVVLLVAAVLTAVVGDLPDMAVIIAVIVLNTTLGALQQIRSDRALTALSALTAPRAAVIRDGRVHDVDATSVVTGDLVELTAGDIVPADAVIQRCESLTVDESMLTGESVPVGKSSGAQVLAGSVVTRGHGYALVSATAHGTMLGGIARSLTGKSATNTPLQVQLSQLGRRLATGAALAALAVIVINLVAGHSWEISLVLGISLAVAAIPESLPAVVTLALALAGRSLADGGVLVRKLSAVEALGSITVLAMDKTGTLTEGRMAVDALWTPDGGAPDERRLLEYAVLCSDACRTPDVAVQRSDDPTEVALVQRALAAGLDVAGLRRRMPRIAESPFDALTASMSTEHQLPGETSGTCETSETSETSGAGETSETSETGETVLRIRKGAPEALLDAAELAGPAGTALAGLVRDGLRVLAVRAGSPLRGSPAAAEALVGLIGLRDPVRQQAPAMISAFRRAGVRPVMISGDHPATAAAVARMLGLDGAEDVLTGARLAAGDFDPVELAGRGVIARVLPAQKTLVVQALREAGEVVAMTGDGVNDAPALRAADVGIAMGAGTEVAKQAAAIVLSSSDLAAMVPAIVEGRRVYDNIRRFLRYALGGGLAEVLIMVIGPFLGMAIPLQAGQILFVNLLTHGLPGVAIGNEAASAGAADRNPRPRDQRLLDRSQLRSIALLGTAVTLVSLLAAGWSAWHDRPGQSTLFVTLTFAQLAIALSGRPSGHRWASNPMLLWSILLNAALVLAAVFTAPLRELFRTHPVTADELIVALIGAGLVAALARLLASRTDRTVAESPAAPSPVHVRVRT